MTYKIFIDGQEGTTGLRIHSRLKNREELEILTLAEEERKNTKARLELIGEADVTFLCLPDSASKEIVELAEGRGRIIDASTAHRTNPDWVYGFPEITKQQKNNIKNSNRVAVPGCHATGFVSLVKPLVELNIADKDYPFSCHSITGYSGGGKAMIAKYESKERNPGYNSPREYALNLEHKHLPEMVAITGIGYEPIFNPIVADYYNGMLVTVPLHKRLLAKEISGIEMQEKFKKYYENQSFIHVNEYGKRPEDGFMAANELADTDGLEIYICGNNQQFALMARYDNLGKGASGAAIQCMNIMLDLPEDAGLIIAK